MEVDSSPDRGWGNIKKSESLRGKCAEVVKVSHHGSANGHDEGFWADHLTGDVLGCISPYRRGSGFLPKLDRLDLLNKRCGRLWVTASPGSGAAGSKGSIVASETRNHGIRRRAAYKLVGQIRLRKKLGALEWMEDVVQPACTAQSYIAQSPTRGSDA
jgi:hypothetical protein